MDKWSGIAASCLSRFVYLVGLGIESWVLRLSRSLSEETIVLHFINNFYKGNADMS